MDSLGIVFRQARDNKGYALDQVSAETHISREYIQAIETDRFDELPGDAYCIGFLNNLSRYYGLNSSEIIRIYKTARSEDPEQYKQQAADVKNPAVRKSGKKSLVIPLLMIILVAVLIWTLIPLFSSSESAKPVTEAENAQPAPVTEETVLASEVEQPQENTWIQEDTAESGLDRTVLFSSPAKKHFAVNIEFSGYCFFRYKIDNSEQIEKYFQKGDRLKLEASNEVKVWMSNAGALKGVVSGHEIFFGDRGVVSSDKIQWEKSADGKFNMVVVPMD